METEYHMPVETAVKSTFSATFRHEFQWIPQKAEEREKLKRYILEHASQDRLFELPDADAIRAPEFKTLIAQKRVKYKAMGVDLSQTNSMEYLEWAIHCLRQNRPVYVTTIAGRQVLRIHADITTEAYGGELSSETNVRWNSAIDRFAHRHPLRRSNEAEVLRLQLWWLSYTMLGEQMEFAPA